MAPLTRDFRDTVMARAQRDTAFRAALLTEAAEALLQGETQVGKAMLRDYVNATFGFEALADATNLPVKSLHRMLSPSGNPTLSNLAAVLRVAQARAGVALEVHIAELA